jgi:hypothetical protein
VAAARAGESDVTIDAALLPGSSKLVTVVIDLAPIR